MNAGEYKLNWPNPVEKGDVLKAVKRGRVWVIRAQSSQDATFIRAPSFEMAKRVVAGHRDGQDLLGDYRTKKAAEAVIKRMNQARGTEIEKEEP